MSDLDPVIEVESAMSPAQRRSAYARFVGANPEYRGAFWADILADLVDRDANLDVTEPLWLAHVATLTPDVAPFYTPAILSLLWATGEAPSHEAALALAVLAAEEAA